MAYVAQETNAVSACGDEYTDVQIIWQDDDLVEEPAVEAPCQMEIDYYLPGGGFDDDHGHAYPYGAIPDLCDGYPDTGMSDDDRDQIPF